MVTALEHILAEKNHGLTQSKSASFQVLCSKTAPLFPKTGGGIPINKVSLCLNDKWYERREINCCVWFFAAQI